jgi:hypothetical protein
MSKKSPEKSPRRRARQEGIGRISAPFVKDTGIIIEKFVEAVKDLFSSAILTKSCMEKSTR